MVPSAESGILIQNRMRWLLLSVVLLSACDADRIAHLEKQNKELQKQLAASKHVDLDTQEKCSNAAQRFFYREYPADRDTIHITQHNHYNQSLGKCFVIIEWHYREAGSKTGSWYNLIALHDVYENDKYAHFNQYTDIGADHKPTISIYDCQVEGKKCSTVEEFNRAVEPLMSN